MKLFMAICVSASWFNPFVWIAARRSAEDVELCCDELVMRGLNRSEREMYPELVLSTAGEERGFSSCLSVSGKALHYRMTNLLNPERQSTGALAAVICTIFLLLIYNQVGITFR